MLNEVAKFLLSYFWSFGQYLLMSMSINLSPGESFSNHNFTTITKLNRFGFYLILSVKQCECVRNRWMDLPLEKCKHFQRTSVQQNN